MKKYIFTVEHEDFKSTNSLAEQILNKVADEKRQKELTYKINRETTQAHKTILEKLVYELNRELSPLNVRFENHQFNRDSNSYKRSMVLCKVGNYSFVIELGAYISNREFDESKYSTYTGAYEIRIGENASTSYMANQSDKLNAIYTMSSKGEGKSKTHQPTIIASIVEIMEFRITENLHKQVA